MLPVIALMYHDVEAIGEPNEKRNSPRYQYVISEDEFRRHLDFITASRLQVLTLSAYYSGLAKGTADPMNSIVLTFDDGHTSTEQVGMPLMREYGMAGTAQVIGGFAGRDKYTMSSAQMRNLISAGWDIGAHGLNHVVLTELDDRTLHQELSGSKAALEGHLKQPVDMMSVPQGPYNSRVRKAAISAGYTSVMCSIPGINLADADRFSLRRMTIMRTLDMVDFKRIVTRDKVYYARESLRRRVFMAAQNLLGESRYRAVRRRLLSK
jgi:peptidoglycan/xylan/chitin deacetylase (PgdA/CDA1 family)